MKPVKAEVPATCFVLTIKYDDAPQRRCKYKPCPVCDGCGVCRDFHGNFVAGCTDECPYRWWHRVRDWFRRQLP